MVRPGLQSKAVRQVSGFDKMKILLLASFVPYPLHNAKDPFSLSDPERRRIRAKRLALLP